MFFKKKKLQSKFQKNEMVEFTINQELKIGSVYNIYKNNDGKILYDIQIGGECPSLIKNIDEAILRKKEK